MNRRPPRSTLFPYPTLFQSLSAGQAEGHSLETNEPPVGTSQPACRPTPPCTILGALRAEEQKGRPAERSWNGDRKSTRLNSSHANISYAVFCLKKTKKPN